MTQRNLRTVPAALLMTTALSWSLPTLAQTGSANGAAPSRSASSTAPAAGRSGGSGLHPGTTLAPGAAAAGTSTGRPPATMGTAPAAGGTNSTGAPSGSGSGGLPPGFEPAMPGAKSSAPAAPNAGGSYQAPGARP